MWVMIAKLLALAWFAFTAWAISENIRYEGRVDRESFIFGLLVALTCGAVWMI